jgi:hypothetical protein
LDIAEKELERDSEVENIAEEPSIELKLKSLGQVLECYEDILQYVETLEVSEDLLSRPIRFIGPPGFWPTVVWPLIGVI